MAGLFSPGTSVPRIIELLADQLTNCVLWEPAMKAMVNDGALVSRSAWLKGHFQVGEHQPCRVPNGHRTRSSLLVLRAAAFGLCDLLNDADTCISTHCRSPKCSVVVVVVVAVVVCFCCCCCCRSIYSYRFWQSGFDWATFSKKQ